MKRILSHQAIPHKLCPTSIATTHNLPRLLFHPPPTPRLASYSTTPPRHGPFTNTHASAELLSRKHQIPPDPDPVPSPERTRLIRRSKIAGWGIVVCALCMFAIAQSGLIPAPAKKKKMSRRDGDGQGRLMQLDGPPAIVGLDSSSSSSSSIRDRVEQVPTGTSTVPTFPKTIQLASATAQQEYQLVGLGVRTVSFLSIQVYVVGLYVAVSDIAALQERLVRKMDPVATTLVPGERQRLRALLMDARTGEEVWEEILREGGIRTALRIVPTRNTDFMHLRDGWVRGITARCQARMGGGDASFDDEAFGASLNAFKAIWGSGARKSVPKGETLLLTRDGRGKMAAWLEEKEGRVRLGGVDDERISRLIWLGYLAGKNVSSEGARKSVVDGLVDFVERPVGTVAQQVV